MKGIGEPETGVLSSMGGRALHRAEAPLTGEGSGFSCALEAR